MLAALDFVVLEAAAGAAAEAVVLLHLGAWVVACQVGAFGAWVLLAASYKELLKNNSINLGEEIVEIYDLLQFGNVTTQDYNSKRFS